MGAWRGRARGRLLPECDGAGLRSTPIQVVVRRPGLADTLSRMCLSPRMGRRTMWSGAS